MASNRCHYICDKGFDCCGYKYYSSEDDIEPDARECGHLVETEYVIHARWLDNNGVQSCSNCGNIRPYEVIGNKISYWTSDYCRMCGAKMKYPTQ